MSFEFPIVLRRRIRLLSVVATLFITAIGCDDGASTSGADDQDVDTDIAANDLDGEPDRSLDAPSDVEDVQPDAPADIAGDSGLDSLDDADEGATPDLPDDIPDEPIGDDAADAELPDGDEPDGSPIFGEAWVTVLDRSGTPLWGATVVHQRADGNVFRTVILDQQEHPGGRVELDMLTGDGVTVAHQREDAIALYTVIDLVPGDEVTVQDTRPLVSATLRDASQFVTLPEPTIDGSPLLATRYAVTNGCRNVELNELPAEPVRLDFPSSCVGDDEHLDLQAWALDEDNAPIAFTSVFDSPFPQDDAVVLPSWRNTDSLDTVGVALTNSPVDSRPSARLTVMSGGRTFAVWPPAQPVDSSTVVLAGEGLARDWVIAPDFADAVVHDLTVRFGSAEDPLRGEIVYEHRDPTLAQELAIDLDDDLLGRIELASIDGTSDSARPYLTWYLTEDEMAADAVELVVHWSESGASAPKNREWTIIGPPDLPENVRLPRLPSELVQAQPTGDIATGWLRVSYWEADFISGFREFVNEWGVGPRLRLPLELVQYTLQESRVTNE